MKKDLLHIPKPPVATVREEKLPCESPKPIQEDPNAPQRHKVLREHPNYRMAEDDSTFIKTDDLRGVRLQIDYLKTELLLNQYNIQHTIAVFGGTRIVEPAEAARRLKSSKEALEQDPSNPLLAKKHATVEKILQKSHFYTIAREFGSLVGLSGEGAHDSRITLVTGGGPGIMEAANRGAFDVGAKSIGLNISLPLEQFPNPYISPELCFQLHYFSMRKHHFFERAKALVAFPGGFGTLDEFIEALTLIQTRKILPFPVILVGKAFWDSVISFDYLLEEGVVDAEDLNLFWYAETAEEIWNGILQWHTENGTPLLP